MIAHLPDWHAGFTAVIDADHATAHARGELGIFTLDLLGGAIARLALHHPSSITVNLVGVTSIDRYSARILGAWQHQDATSSAVRIDVVNPIQGAAALSAAIATPRR